MTTYTFDFDEIAEQQDFYREFSRTFELAQDKVNSIKKPPAGGGKSSK